MISDRNTDHVFASQLWARVTVGGQAAAEVEGAVDVAAVAKAVGKACVVKQGAIPFFSFLAFCLFTAPPF